MKLPTQLAWIKQHYEKVILLVVLLGLTASAVVLGLRFPARVVGLQEMGVPVEAKEGQEVKAIDLDVFSGGLAQLDAPLHIDDAAGLLYSSELRVYCIQCGKWIEYRAETCPFCGQEQPKLVASPDVDTDGDGIPDVIEEKWGMDAYDPRDAHLDHDGDGFTTLEEHLAGTDPFDPKVFPSIFVKLRLLGVTTQTFKLRFLAVQKLAENQERYQINARTLDRTYFAKLGGTVEGYKVESYDKENDTLILRQGDAVRRLGRGKIIEDDQMVVQFQFLLDGSQIACKVNEAFELRDRKAKVVEVLPGRKSVRIVTEPDNREYVISMITPDEQGVIDLRSSAPVGADGSGADHPPATDAATSPAAAGFQ